MDILTTIIKSEPFVLSDKCAEVYRNNSLGTYSFLCHACDKVLDSDGRADDLFRHLDSHYYFEGQEQHPDNENLQKEFTMPVTVVVMEESLKAEEGVVNLPVAEPYQPEFIDVNFPIVEQNLSIEIPISDDQVHTENNVIDPKSQKKKSYAGQFPCEVCSKVFKYKAHLKEHYDCHLENRPVFECDICDRKYNRSRSLRKHKKLHHEKQLDGTHMQAFEYCVCDICKYTFTSKSELIEHLQEHNTSYMGKIIKLDITSVDEITESSWITENEINQCLKKLNRISDSTGKKFPCEKCSKVFKYKSHLKEHYNCHLENRPVFECDICDRKYFKRRTLMYHIRQHHEHEHLDTKFENCICDICHNTFTSKLDLIAHLQEHNTSTGENVLNSGLHSNNENKSSQETKNQADQKKLNQKSDAGKFQCEVCLRVFKYKPHLKEHYSIHLENRPVYECDICDRKYFRIRSLRTHQKIHPEKYTEQIPTYLCNTCNRKLPNEQALKDHSILHENNICHICGKKFTFTQNLKTHIRIHTGEKPYECPVCQRRFIHGSEMKVHVKRAHTGEKNYQCEHCGKGYFRYSDLKVHRRRHTQDKAYQCEYCDDKFYDLTARKNHERKHTGEKPYKCKVCDHSYRTGNLLRQHSVLHTGTKPHSCKYCDMKFAQAAGRRSHEKSRHGAL